MGGRQLNLADETIGRVVAAFGQRLHARGVPVTPERSLRFAHALALTEASSKEQLYWAARVNLLSSHDQVEAFDRIFYQCFVDTSEFSDNREDESPDTITTDVPEEQSPGADGPEPEEQEEESDAATPSGADALADDDGAAGPSVGDPSDETAEEESSGEPSVLLMSSDERLALKDFAACTPTELAHLARLVEQLRFVPPPRRTRRLQRSRRGNRVDIRATVRRSYRTGGDPAELINRRRRSRPRRVVLIADVSGSMEPYSRLYLHLMRGAVQALHAEAFVFATRLTRLTRVLASHHPDVAYQRALETASDWSGGTRIGQALTDFIDGHGRRGIARGAVVVIVSDGWEVAGPEQIEEAMSRLSRLAHHIIWINPRKAADSYRPLVGGMAAALPYVDTFVPGHSLRALEDVVEAIRNATQRSTGGARSTSSATEVPETVKSHL